MIQVNVFLDNGYVVKLDVEKDCLDDVLDDILKREDVIFCSYKS